MHKTILPVQLTLALVALFGTGALCAQSLRITVANSSAPNALYDMLFSPAGTTLLNADGAAMVSDRSVAFIPGSSEGVDVAVADSGASAIVRYVAPSGTPPLVGVSIWSAASGVAGPQHPDGLSVDAGG
ncbi:MAG TPA: hypothetical protein VEY89_04740, partial [Candidatus Dormibacteraeota bacterium]|nr:hypothetical protein [Candidatus Dormibacteraeota bacterium]